MRAYLISGEFRVHRADCHDCQREARRSDSPDDAEEYASKADVIVSLWSDIIAEDPELYGTSRRPGQPGSRNHLPALRQRAARNQPGRGQRRA